MQGPACWGGSELAASQSTPPTLAAAFPPRRARLRPAGRTPAAETPPRRRATPRRRIAAAGQQPPGVVAMAERLANEDFQQPHARRDRTAQFAGAVDQDSPLLFPMPAVASRTASFTRGFCRLVISGINNQNYDSRFKAACGFATHRHPARQSPPVSCVNHQASATIFFSFPNTSLIIFPSDSASYPGVWHVNSMNRGRPAVNSAQDRTAAADVSTAATLRRAARGRNWADRESRRRSGCRVSLPA